MKKFLQKSCAWLVMLVAMFAMSMSAMAQDATFSMSSGSFDLVENQGQATQVTAKGSMTSWNGFAEFNGDGHYLVLECQDNYEITKVVFTGVAGWNASIYASQMKVKDVSEEIGALTLTYEVFKWEGNSKIVRFEQNGSMLDVTFSGCQVWLTAVAPSAPIEYTVNFTGNVPAGCSASYGDDTFTSNGSFEVAKSLKKEDLNITTTADYYADVTYDAENHTWTVAFKPWFVYTVDITIPSYHPNAAVKFDGEWYENGQTIKSKNEISASDVTVNDLNGYDESVTVEDNVVKAVYTESAPITYTVTFNIVPEGAYAWINGVKYEGNDTFQTNLELSNTNIEQVYCPEGYYDNSYYRADEHTFYINYIEYDKYYVVVEGTDDSNAGVFFEDMPYGNGSVIYSSYTLYDYYLTPNTVSGYNVEVTIDDHTVTVTYTEKSVPTAPWSITFDNTNNAECIVIDNNNDGSKWQWDAYRNRFQYTYNGSNAADDYLVLPAIKLEAGKNYNISVNCGAYSTSEKLEIVCGTAPTVADLNTTVISEQTLPDGSKTLTKDGFTVATDGNYYFAFHVTSPADKWYAYAYGFSIDVIEPEAAPEFPVEGVAYEIKNIGLGKYINISSAETDAATVSDESEGLYFTWDEMKAAFTIQDADGNYLGKTTNAWTTSATTPEYWIVETVSDGVYAFKSVSSKYLAPNKNDGTDNRLMRDKDSNFYYTFTIAPFVVIPDAELTVTDAEWTTFALDAPFTLPEGYTAYIVTGVDDTTLELKALEGGAPEVKNVTFMPSTDAIVDGKLSDGTVTISSEMGIYLYNGNPKEYYSFISTNEPFTMTIAAPEGTEITEISFNADAGYTNPTWPDGTTGYSYSPATATNEVVVTMSPYYGYAYYYGISVSYTVTGSVVVPSYTGVLVNGPAGTNIPYTKKPGATPSDVTGNLLVGCTADATWSEAGKSYYKFSLNAANEAGSEGFYWGVDGGASINAHAGKAYLVLDADAASNSRYLINGFGEPTGIDTVLSTEATEAIYNLQGQRVNAAKGGVYVKGGKKIIVK